MSWCGCSNWDDRRQIQCFDAAALIQVWLSLLPFLYWQWRLTLYNWTKIWHIEHVCMGIGQNIHKDFFFSWLCSYIMMLLCKCHCCLCCARETIWSCWIEERSCYLHIGHNNSCANQNVCVFFFFSLFNGRKSLSGESDTMSLRLLEPEVDSYEWRFASETHGTELCALGLRMQALTALAVTSSADFSNQILITMAQKTTTKKQAHNRPGIILLWAVQKSILCPSCFPSLNLPDYNSPAV